MACASTPRRPVQDLRTGLHQALELTGAHSRDVWKPFWAAQQRFFKLLCISVKVPLPWAPCSGPILIQRLLSAPCACTLRRQALHSFLQGLGNICP